MVVAVGWILADCTASVVCTAVEWVAGCNRRGDKEMVAGPTTCKKWLFVLVGIVAVLAFAAGKLEKDLEIRSLDGIAALEAECNSAFPVVVPGEMVDKGSAAAEALV